MLIFGAIQVVTCQIPNFHNMEWLSILAAAMSFCYSFIGLGLGLAKTIGERVVPTPVVCLPSWELEIIHFSGYMVMQEMGKSREASEESQLPP